MRREPTSFGSVMRRVNWSRVTAGILLAGSFWLLVTFFAGTRFRVEDVRVSGISLVSADDIVSASRLANTSIFRVRQEAVAEKLRSDYGFVDTVSVRCVMPSTVHIDVEEHDQVVVWESGGQYWWVDTEGRVLGANAHPEDLIVLHDVKSSDVLPSEYVLGVPWQLALQIAHELPGARAFDYTPEEGLVLHVTDKQWPVYLGHEGDAVAKIALLRELVNQLGAQGAAVKYIDLRNERHPIYSYS